MRHVLNLLLLCTALTASAQERSYHANGNLRSTVYMEGPLERFIVYHESGRVKEMGAYRNGRKHGKWCQYGEDGTVLAEARFERGRRVGVWVFRTPGDRLAGRLHYSPEGILTAGERYAEDGLLAQRTY